MKATCSKCGTKGTYDEVAGWSFRLPLSNLCPDCTYNEEVRLGIRLAHPPTIKSLQKEGKKQNRTMDGSTPENGCLGSRGRKLKNQKVNYSGYSKMLNGECP